MSQEVVSFVLRFVREAGVEQGARWRGTVRHVQGSTERQFSQFGEALKFMQSHMNETIEAASKDGATLAKSNPLFETAKLWGEFVPQYNKLVLDSVSNAVSTMWHLTDDAGQASAPETGPAKDELAENEEDKDVVKGLEAKLDTVSQQLSQLTASLTVLQNDVAALKEAQTDPADDA